MARILQEEIDALLRSHGHEPPGAPSRSWLASALQEAPGEWSIRRIVFALSFVFGCGLCVWGMLRGDIGPGVREFATTIIIAAFAAVGIGRFAEAMDK